MKHTSSQTLRRVLGWLRPQSGKLVLMTLLAAVYVAGSLYIPILVGRAIDRMVGAGQVDAALVARCGVRIALIAAVCALAQWCMQALGNRVCFGVSCTLRREAFSKLQRLPLSYLDSHPAGDLLSRMIADIDQLSDGLILGANQLFTGVLTIVGTLGFMLWLNWKIALLVVLLTPMSLLVAKFIAGRTYSMFKLQSQAKGEQTAELTESIAGARVVQAFSQEASRMEAFERVNRKLEAASVRATFFSSLTNPTTRFIYSVIYACVGLAGAFSAVSGAITVGSLTSLLSYANQYSKPFNEITGVITELQNALACAGRVFELLDAEDETPDGPDTAVLQNVRGQLTLRDVSFRYEPEKPLIEGLQLQVSPGQRVAIVGPTGCGKTTLINLLMRFYDVCGGAILLEGQDIRKLERESLRRSYGMVLQDTWLKTGTVRENIALARPDAPFSEIELAAKAAHADSFIRRLPQGYDTQVSDGGGSLSAGQRQLLCIARIMLCLPPMLILDEATSSIDTRTEQKIQSAFAKLMQGRTSFIVAHRLSTIREADVILVMKDGHIIEQGKHDELLAQNGFYAKLYHSQFEA